jgi:ParB/RepB/Spo0J family partition protein
VAQTTTNSKTPDHAEQLPNAVNGMELRMVKVSDIVIPEDRHRRRSRRHSGSLGESMKEIGLDSPVSVSPGEDGSLILVGGGGRLEQAIEHGWEEIHVLVKVRDARGRAASTAAENLAREDLSPAEEADALELMIQAGDSPQEAAKKVGLSARTGTMRMPLVELPEDVRKAFHHDLLSAGLASLVKTLYDGNHDIGLEIGELGVKIPEDVSAALSRGAGEFFRQLPELHREAKLRGRPPFLATFRRGSDRGRSLEWSAEDRCRIKLKGTAGKWFTAASAEADYWSRPRIVMSEEDLDQAVALGLAYHSPGEQGTVWVHDRGWLTGHINEFVLPRMQKEAEAAANETPLKKLKKATKKKVDLADMTAGHLAPTLARRFSRELQPKAHDANQDLGLALTTKLGVKKLTREVALFFAYETLGRDTTTDIYMRSYDEGARRLAECAARVMPEWATVETVTLKSGKTKRKITYLTGEDAERKMWEYVKAARTPEEILQRALQIHAAAMLFRRECGANGKEPRNQTPENATATQALGKLAKPVVPMSVKRLERAIREHNPQTEAERMIAAAKAEAAGQQTTEDRATAPAARVKRIDRKAQALDLITAAPGITISELAVKMEVKPNYLYKALAALQQAGKVTKQGRGWHPADSDTGQVAKAA